MIKSIDDVRQFWETNPLWSGESSFEEGTKEWFEEHRKVVIDDCFAGKLDERIFPSNINQQKILDLGCGPGFWTIEFALSGCKDITAADLTEKALELTRRRCELYGVNAKLSQQNAEKLAFNDKIFSHVNCLGVIHHSPDTEACISEISRVLTENGTATISVYYWNIFLQAWPLFKCPAKLIAKFGGELTGRGRENIYTIEDVNELVRLYDGQDNPIGKAYTRQKFVQMLSPYFHVQEIWLHFFPARTLPFPIPKGLHKILEKHVGFLMIATLKKR
jgi:2-polyprenyl-3-methyl-5-hydroxy-6-metoxy-1,4-benzoquinol methylase